MTKKIDIKGNRVTIDGVRYLPETTLQAEARKLLNEIYIPLWANGHYDALTESVGNFARPLADKMMRLNEIMGFRE